MSALTDILGQAATAAVNTVVIDSELLPAPITINLAAPSTGNSSAFGPIAKPSITIYDAKGAQVYSSAPYGAVADRTKSYMLIAAAAAGLFLMGYGAFRLLKR